MDAHRSSDIRGLRFSRLPGSSEEVKAIREILGTETQIFTGPEALEEVLAAQQSSPRILHLATHGFFLSDQNLRALDDGSSFGRGIAVTAKSQPSGPPIKFDNPLLRSGLALAGANQGLTSDNLQESDGLFTAEEVLGLRLHGTELVVLSACNTGVGEVKTGEGVYGLRRAFIQAGTKGLVMSMWPVPDRETKELMVRFYENLQTGMSRGQALRQAALTQKEITKKRYGSDNPLYWGAFVYLGEP